MERRDLEMDTQRSKREVAICSSFVVATDLALCIPFSNTEMSTIIRNMAQKFFKDYSIASSDLFSEVLNVLVKRGDELLTDHSLVVCYQLLLKPWLNRKSHRSSVAYRIKWEALAYRDVKNSSHTA